MSGRTSYPPLSAGPDSTDPLQLPQRDDPGGAQSEERWGVYAHLRQLFLQVSGSVQPACQS